MAEFYNLQRKIKFDALQLRSFAENLPEKVDEAVGKNLAVALVSDRRMIELNSLFRGKNTTTDVLSFPHEPDDFDPDKTTSATLLSRSIRPKNRRSKTVLLWRAS